MDAQTKTKVASYTYKWLSSSMAFLLEPTEITQIVRLVAMMYLAIK